MGTKNMNRPIYVQVIKQGGLYRVGACVVIKDKRQWGESEREFVDNSLRDKGKQ